MPLLNIMGITLVGKSFYACFAFLHSETEDDYCWALEAFREVVEMDMDPIVGVTDRELALMGAIKDTFLGSKNILCRWHIDCNVLKVCKPKFNNAETWDEFYKEWQ